MGMTFVGFNVDKMGQCFDFKSNKVIEDCRVPVSVCEYLAKQGVDLQKENCNKWTKYVKIYIHFAILPLCFRLQHNHC